MVERFKKKKKKQSQQLIKKKKKERNTTTQLLSPEGRSLAKCSPRLPPRPTVGNKAEQASVKTEATSSVGLPLNACLSAFLA